MLGGNFGERSKAISNAMLADRTSAILKRFQLNSTGQIELSDQEKSIISDAVRLIKSSNYGFKATQESPSEMGGFLVFIDSLNIYQASFSAMVHAQMLNSPGDIPKTLQDVEKIMTEISQGSRPTNLDNAIKFFKAFSEISSKKALDLVKGPLPQMPQPQF